MNKHKAYLNTFNKTIGDLPIKRDVLSIVDLSKAAFNGAMAVLTLPDVKEVNMSQLQEAKQLIIKVRQVFGELTPREVQQVFQVDKEYDGHKYEMKDYFYTQRYLKSIDCNQPIGDQFEDFIWEYLNLKLRKFYIVSEKYESLWIELEIAEEVNQALEPITVCMEKINTLKERKISCYKQLSQQGSIIENKVSELSKLEKSKTWNLKLSMLNAKRKMDLRVDIARDKLQFNQLVSEKNQILSEIYKANEALLNIEDIYERIEVVKLVNKDVANSLIRRLNLIKDEQEEIRRLIKL